MGEIAHVERPVCEYAKKKGFHVRKCTWTGRAGAPDRFFFGKGKHMWIEFKAPGKKPQPHQQLEIDRMRQNGLVVHVIDNKEDGFALFD